MSKQLINEAVRKLTAQTQPKESGDTQKEYQEKRRLARKLEQDGTRQLSQKVRGVRMTITMEPFSGVEKDKQD